MGLADGGQCRPAPHLRSSKGKPVDPHTFHRRRHLSALAAVAAIVFFAVPAQALAGPVILGGDDLTSHGSHDGTSNVEGWKYMEVALGNISSQVTRSNDNSIAALGSAEGGGGAGAAIASAAAPNGLPVTYYEGAAAIQGFF